MDRENFAPRSWLLVISLLMVWLPAVCRAGNDGGGGVPEVVQPAVAGKGDGFVESRSLQPEGFVRRRKTFKNGARQHYAGRAEIVIKYYRFDPYVGRTVFVREKHLGNGVEIFIGPPLKTGNTVENNPFNLEMYPRRDDKLVKEGYLDLVSAALFTVEHSRDLLLQYWNMVADGNRFSGRLNRTHIPEAAAANLLWAWEDIAGMKMLKPFPLAINCSLDGVFMSGGIELVIRGESSDGFRKFTVKVSARRR